MKAPYQNEKQRSERGLKIGKLTLRLIESHNTKLVIGRNDRADLPHLTISWKNPTAEIDFHLTTRVRGGDVYHESLGKIAESDLARVADSLGEELSKALVSKISALRKVRPGWLARNGYWLLHLPEGMQDKLVNNLAAKSKRHGKWTRVVETDFLEKFAQSSEVTDSIYHPSVLHDLARIGFSGPILTQSTRRKRGKRLIGLCLMANPDDRRYWARIDRLTQDILKLSEGFITSSIKKLLPGDTWLKIQSGLQLDEVGINADGNRPSGA